MQVLQQNPTADAVLLQHFDYNPNDENVGSVLAKSLLRVYTSASGVPGHEGKLNSIIFQEMTYIPEFHKACYPQINNP